ncbi:Aste57867_11842 [Aphanomyces stellatus]|uniref:Aste57867_11842 protein n=1 Tax=Aphanomyces stellatus TaxID=120398 RepID=A0A485KU25_9STRA|nr:hypothetical protein As57867_011797 [Aphanomyces stellatus]VFT88697.1 Aste57867_11842 [Aphanomyces stellatus]
MYALTAVLGFLLTFTIHESNNVAAAPLSCRDLTDGDTVHLLASGLDDGWGLASNGDFKAAVVGIPETWKIIKRNVPAGGQYITFQATSTGKYLGRCHQCAPDALPMTPGQAVARFLDWRGQPWTHWVCQDMGNGAVSLQSLEVLGKFLAWCVGCLTSDTMMSPASVFVHGIDWNDQTAQWKIVRATVPNRDFTCTGVDCSDIRDMVD